MSTTTPARRWLTVDKAAAYLSCSRSFLDQDRLSRLHEIPFARLGRHIRYDMADLDAYLERSKMHVREEGL